MNSECGKGAGLQFFFKDTTFFFFTRLEYDGFKVGLSASSFEDADSNATSTEAELIVNRIKVVVNYRINSGTINIQTFEPPVI